MPHEAQAADAATDDATATQRYDGGCALPGATPAYAAPPRFDQVPRTATEWPPMPDHRTTAMEKGTRMRRRRPRDRAAPPSSTVAPTRTLGRRRPGSRSHATRSGLHWIGSLVADTRTIGNSPRRVVAATRHEVAATRRGSQTHRRRNGHAVGSRLRLCPPTRTVNASMSTCRNAMVAMACRLAGSTMLVASAVSQDGYRPTHHPTGESYRCDLNPGDYCPPRSIALAPSTRRLRPIV